MITKIKNLNDKLCQIVKDDPVRPEINLKQRVNENSDVFVLLSNTEETPLAVTCVKYTDIIPENVPQLLEFPKKQRFAIFYTIWSYQRGAGKNLLSEVITELKKTKPQLERFLTLSPKTELAREFHLKNGANVFKENHSSINYEYSAQNV
jgi:hypothetical protein